MRVALNLEQLLHQPPGGVGSYTAELARVLPVPGDDGVPTDLVPFVARHSDDEVERALRAFDLDGLRPERLPVPRAVLYELWNVLGTPRLGTLSRALRDVDVVHAPSLAVPPRGDVPLVVTVHDAAPLLFPDTYPWHGRWFHARGYAAAARRADVVIAPTNAAADEIGARTAIPRDRIRVVMHGVEQEIVGDDAVAAMRSRLGIGDQPYVLWVGTLEPRKDVRTLVEAFQAVSAAALPHRLVVNGRTGWRDAEQGIRDAADALGERIHFTGTDRVAPDELLAMYRGADLFAFPSRHEGFGMPVLEAMGQGAPVLCSDLPVLREVAGAAGRFVPAGDVDAWGAALVEILGDDAARASLGRRCREHARHFTWERAAAQTRAVYREALGAAP